jgi:hypothetical protein
LLKGAQAAADHALMRISWTSILLYVVAAIATLAVVTLAALGSS